MRLSSEERAAIKSAAVETFGPGAVVRLFGSRVDDRLRGGDIDLHVEVDEGQQHFRNASDFRWRLYQRIEPQKVDLVFQVRARPIRPIDEVAISEGVIL